MLAPLFVSQARLQKVRVPLFALPNRAGGMISFTAKSRS
jgi:hypothetical protein